MKKRGVEFDRQIHTLAEVFKAHGHTLFAVGGYVRDALLKREPKELDACSDALPEEVEAMFEDDGGVAVKTLDAQLGVSRITIAGGVKIEHATFREECYEAGAGHRPSEVVLGSTLSRDALRRDFTVNARYFNILTGEIIDEVGGFDDIRDRILRTVRVPAQTLGCDGERILRLARLAGELGFVIDHMTFSYAKQNVGLVGELGKGRMMRELNRILELEGGGEGSPVAVALTMLNELGALEYAFPEVYAKGEIDRAILRLSLTNEGLGLRLAALYKDVGGGPGVHPLADPALMPDVLKRQGYPKAVRERACTLVAALWELSAMRQTNEQLKLRLARLGPLLSRDLIRLWRADELSGGGGGTGVESEQLERAMQALKRERAPLDETQLAISGSDIASLIGTEDGPLIGRMKERLWEECVIDPKLNNEEDLSSRVLALRGGRGT